MRRSRAAAAALAAGALVAVAVPGASTATATSSAVGSGVAAAAGAVAPRAALTVTSSTFFGTHNWGPARSQAMITGTNRMSNTLWTNVEPSSGAFTWADLDWHVSEGKRRGNQQILFVLGRTPAWAAGPNRSSDRTSPATANPPRTYAFWDRYVTAVATHLRNQNVALQVWNEANLTTFWNGTPAQMAEMTARAYRIIKRVAPRITVVAASTTMRLAPDYTKFYPAYLAGLKARGWPVDALSIHSYPASNGTPVTSRGYIGKARADINRYGGAAKPLWITEINYGLAGPGKSHPRRTITGITAANWVGRTYLDARRLGVSRVYWYEQMYNESIVGIQMWTGTPGMRAERTLYSWMAGATWYGCRTSSPMVICRIGKGAKVWTIQWSEGTRRVVTVPARATRVCNLLGQCTVVRPGGRVSITANVTRLGPA